MLTTRNPFLSQAVPDPWTRVEADVPQIHQQVFELCHDLIEEVGHGAGSTCLLIYGEAGAGNTHLLSRLRDHLEKHAEAIFISVRLQTVAPRIWRHLRTAFAADLLREIEPGVTRLDRVLEKLDPPESLAPRIGLSYGLQNVVTQYRQKRHRLQCAAWLRGDSLSEAALAKLGLVSEDVDEVAQEDQANQVILDLCRTVAPLPVVFAFDQIEALETVPGDLTALHAWGQAVADMQAELNNMAAISSMQASYATRLEEKLDRYIFDRLSLHRAELHPLNWRQGQEIVRKRLDSDAELAELRVEQRLGPFWPLQESMLKELFGTADQCTARRLIHHSAERFEQARGIARRKPLTTAEFLTRELDQRREQAVEDPAADAEELLLTSLAILLEFIGEQAPSITLIGAATTPAGREGVIQILNQRLDSALADKLENVEQRWDAVTDPPLILLRDASLTIGPNAKKTREILARLQANGAFLAQPSAEVLSTLEALRSLHADAQSGNLVHHGDAISTSQLREWFSARIPPSLDDFLEELKPKAGKDHFVSDLLDFLSVRSVVKLEEAAQAVRVAPEMLVEYARHHSAQFGFMAGPPAILFRAVPGRTGDSCETG